MPLSACAEGTYKVTEQELVQLERALTRLEAQSESRERRLTDLTERLAALNADLEKSRLTVGSLQERNQRFAGQLESANASLQEYAREEGRTKARLRRQRNFAWACAFLLVILVKG